jgi:hypothetical protein
VDLGVPEVRHVHSAYVKRVGASPVQLQGRAFQFHIPVRFT